MSGTLTINMMSGMLAGALASVVSHPFDVVKTQRMASPDHGPAALRGRAAAPAEGTMGLIRRAVAEEGLATLWKGLVRPAPPRPHVRAKRTAQRSQSCARPLPPLPPSPAFASPKRWQLRQRVEDWRMRRWAE